MEENKNVVSEQNVQPEAPKKKSPIGKILIILAILAVAGYALWFFVLKWY